MDFSQFSADKMRNSIVPNEKDAIAYLSKLHQLAKSYSSHNQSIEQIDAIDTYGLFKRIIDSIESDGYFMDTFDEDINGEYDYTRTDYSYAKILYDSNVFQNLGYRVHITHSCEKRIVHNSGRRNSLSDEYIQAYDDVFTVNCLKLVICC